MGTESCEDPSEPVRRKKSTAVRILKPSAVMGTVVLLAVCSIVGFVMAGRVLMMVRNGMSVFVSQGLVLTASLFSVLYVVLHGVSAYYNEPVGFIRPPELRLHAACFIIARLVLLFWLTAFVASAVAAGRTGVCKIGGPVCTAQVTDVLIAVAALLATGTILTALEACQYPFASPEAFHVARKISVRVSGFGEDFFDCSISRAPSMTEGIVGHSELKTSPRRQPLPDTPTTIPDPEYLITPLPPDRRQQRVQGWNQDWNHLVEDTKGKGVTKSDSAISGLSRSSSGYISSGSSEIRSEHSVSKRGSRPRVVTPSSSISNLTKRSPLSTMRSADFPDVVVRPDLRYCPPSIPPPHQWNLSRTASLNQLLPTADIRALQRRASIGAPPPLFAPRPSRHPPQLAHLRGRPPIPIRRSSDRSSRASSAIIEYRLSLDLEHNLEEHAKKIESMSVERSGSDRELKPQPPPKLPLQPPARVDTKSSCYRKKKPWALLSETQMKEDLRPPTATTLQVQAAKPAPKPYRRLSLGDLMTSSFGKMFDV